MNYIIIKEMPSNTKLRIEITLNAQLYNSLLLAITDEIAIITRDTLWLTSVPSSLISII